jgi:hypothetical protein
MLFNIYSLSILTIRRKKQHFDLPGKALSLSPNVPENCPKPFLSSKQLQYFPLIKTCFKCKGGGGGKGNLSLRTGNLKHSKFLKFQKYLFFRQNNYFRLDMNAE